MCSEIIKQKSVILDSVASMFSNPSSYNLFEAYVYLYVSYTTTHWANQRQ